MCFVCGLKQTNHPAETVAMPVAQTLSCHTDSNKIESGKCQTSPKNRQPNRQGGNLTKVWNSDLAILVDYLMLFSNCYGAIKHHTQRLIAPVQGAVWRQVKTASLQDDYLRPFRGCTKIVCQVDTDYTCAGGGGLFGVPQRLCLCRGLCSHQETDCTSTGDWRSPSDRDTTSGGGCQASPTHRDRTSAADHQPSTGALKLTLLLSLHYSLAVCKSTPGRLLHTSRGFHQQQAAYGPASSAWSHAASAIREASLCPSNALRGPSPSPWEQTVYPSTGISWRAVFPLTPITSLVEGPAHLGRLDNGRWLEAVGWVSLEWLVLPASSKTANCPCVHEEKLRLCWKLHRDCG